MAGQTRDHSLLAGRVQAQFGMLTLQFLLGMVVNLLGLPDQNTGGVKVLSGSLLGLHVLLALGLIINAALIVRLARTTSDATSRLARGAGAGIGAATVFGVLTVAAPWSNFWSFLMAAAFIAALALYGRLFVQARLA